MLKSVTDVPDAKDLGEEGLGSPEHHQQPKSSCPHTGFHLYSLPPYCTH